MPDPHATVTLVPLFEDIYPLRTLTITDNDKAVSIGRASKRENRNRNPSAENAWFESQVMSRDHASLKILPDQNTVFITDCGSTHGTFLNGRKLVTDVNTPLRNGDTIRFGVDVDRGQEVFEPIEVSCKVEWLKPQPVAIPDDDIAIKVDPSPSTNTFSVPEDDSDMEDTDLPSDDSSKESVARSWETTVLQPMDTSLVSPASSVQSVQSVQSDEHSKDGCHPFWGPLLASRELTSETVPDPTPVVPDLLGPLSDTKLVSDTNPSPAKPVSDAKICPAESASDELPSEQQAHEDSLPAICYQQVPETHYSDWTMMRPMFMRLADMAWGESNNIPDVDHDRRIIHAARRCSISQDSYWVDDTPSFRPCVGTEVYWEPDSEDSDTSFHRMPGNLLRYWSVDKRRYWVINEDEGGERVSNWWWIVEKPLELLSEDLKRQLETETEVEDCHKCWIVRAWEPRMIGDRWCDVAPYWDPNFDENWLSDDQSVDSDEEAQGYEEYVAQSDALSDSSESYPRYPCLMYDSDSNHGEGCELSDDSEEEDFEEDYDEDSEEDGEISDESDDESDCSDNGCLEHHIPQNPDIRSLLGPELVKELERANNANAIEVPKHVSAQPFEGQSLNPARIESKPLTGQTAPGMTNPGARFPTHSVSGELPSSCQNKYPPMQRKIESTVGVPFLSHEFKSPYHDGPFSTRYPAEDASVPCLATYRKSHLKRTASEMESSSLEADLSQDAQRLPVEPTSQSDLDLNTISSEAKDAISSALAENVSAFAENERPAKRIKSSHSISKSLASHATTAVISALLGGLGTIAVLAALPNEYFQ